jgi:ABC-type multidrug transport system permease subunit
LEDFCFHFQGVLFIYLCESSYPCLYGFLYEIPKDLPLGKREHSLGFYHPATFYLGKTLSFLPGIAAEVVITTSIFYFIVGLHVYNGLGFLVTISHKIIPES